MVVVCMCVFCTYNIRSPFRLTYIRLVVAWKVANLTLHIESARAVCFCTERTQKRVKSRQFHMFSQFYKSALYRRFQGPEPCVQSRLIKL